MAKAETAGRLPLIRGSIFEYRRIRTMISGAIRGRSSFAKKPKQGDYLDIGCGPNIRPQFFNLDYHWRPGVDICWDVRNRFPIPDNYIGGIFSEHCFEHITLEDFLNVSKDIYRIMMPGAYARIIVPDGGLYLQQYARHAAGDDVTMPYGERDRTRNTLYTPIVSVNRIIRNHGHRFIYDFETLEEALRRAGFRDIRRVDFRSGADERLLVDSPERQVESLYVEARK